MEFLSAQDISKRYANHQALDDVSLSIRKQSIFGILGPNGAGKTTLIRIINRIAAPDAGIVTLEGETISDKHIPQIGYLPEERGLYKKMKVGEQVLYLAQLKGLSKQQAMVNIKHWFVKFDMQTWWDKRIEELSKGMQQKVQFIVTVMHNPRLLIFDEPFSGFDPINAQMLKNEILDLRDKGATVIFSTHNMSSVEEICDDIALINHSRVVLSGNMSEIRQRYKSNRYTIRIRTVAQELPFEAGDGFTVQQAAKAGGILTAILQSNHKGQANKILQRCLTIGEILTFEEVIPSMNDIFIQAVNQ